ncbi:serine/threonine protein kinase [Halalkalibacterium halodurans]|uniref:Serine/threonine protein kinase n=1 Tax=Halalkalibacterium halodurans TaxID=86665 RepID=A0A0M0KDS4_ALKHA|nr:serine/threonine protein kinase [Halalkalibacterium halodurans]TPE68497.1 protein kinase family protein [Halalkalibacterium halodurans]
MMKNNELKSLASNLPSGTRIVGKWHKQRYRIIRKIGSGATGTVYLAESIHGNVAVKVADSHYAITSEVNVLRHFQKVQGERLGPSLLDVDDFVTSRGTIPFYTMEYVRGTNIVQFMAAKGEEWLGLLIVQLLGDLDRLHQAGWAFGDLKPDNLLVTGPPVRIRWLDVGGTTLLGRSIKEFTEFYDRGYWGLGTRVAEPSYDLFAVAMIMLHCYDRKHFGKKEDKPLQQMKRKMDSIPQLKPFRPIMLRALQSKYETAHQMREDMIQALNHAGKETTSSVKTRSSRAAKRASKNDRRNEKKSSYFVEIFLIASFLLFLSILYLFGQIM